MSASERIAGHISAVNWHAVRLYRLSRSLHENGHVALALLVAAANRVFTGVEIPPTAQFGEGLVIVHGHGIVVHHATRAGANCTLYQQATIGSRSADGLPPVLGDGVTLFPGAKVLGAISIGDGASVGANAVVIEDLPSNCVAVAGQSRVLGS